METLQFKTNINCANCVKRVTASLNELPDATWEVNTQHPDKILTVQGVAITESEVIAAVEEAGFDAEKLIE